MLGRCRKYAGVPCKLPKITSLPANDAEIGDASWKDLRIHDGALEGSCIADAIWLNDVSI
jgi:hypothetical protein